MSSKRRSDVARLASLARWSKERSRADLTIRSVRRHLAGKLSSELGVDAGVAEQVLFMQTLPAWERLARGLRRSRLGKVAPCC
jgi:hypothetical protein